MKKLADVEWLKIGSNKEYDEVKHWIAHICRDVTHAGCIDELCINDICIGLRQKGFEVVPAEEIKNCLTWNTDDPKETGDYIARVLWDDGSQGVWVRYYMATIGWDVYSGKVLEWTPLPK